MPPPPAPRPPLLLRRAGVHPPEDFFRRNRSGTHHEATVKRLAAAGDVDGVQCALQEMRLRGVECTEGALVAAIGAFAHAGSADRALKTFYRARGLGCRAPGVRVYNHLLDALLRENLVGAIVPVYENMRKAGVEPNVYTYNLLIKALCQNDRVDAARKMLDEMARKGCYPDEASHGTVVSRMQEVLLVVDEMVQRGLQPNVVTIVDAFFKAKELRMACAILARMGALDVFNSMKRNACFPNAMTYSTLVDGFSKDGDQGGAMFIWNDMITSGFKPNIVVYTNMVDAFCKKMMFDQAENLIDKMLMDNCPPNTVTFNMLIGSLCDCGRVGRAMGLEGMDATQMVGLTTSCFMVFSGKEIMQTPLEW
ncbi:hypothetical protein ABZP36_029158 [Zizania latifolia]